MKRPRRISLFLCAAGVAAAALAPPSDAAPAPEVVKVSKHRDGPYDGSELAANVAKTKSFYMRVANTESGKHEVTLTETLGGYGVDDFKVSWYRGHKNVSQDVRTSGHDFELKAGHPQVFRARVKAIKSNTDPLCVAGRFENPSAGADAFGLVSIGDPGICSG